MCVLTDCVCKPAVCVECLCILSACVRRYVCIVYFECLCVQICVSGQAFVREGVLSGMLCVFSCMYCLLLYEFVSCGVLLLSADSSKNYE